MNLIKDNRGMALIMAVAIVGILSAIATTFAYNMKIEQKVAGNFKNYLKAKFLAEAGVAKARTILGIYANSDNYLWATFTALNQPWALENFELTGTIGSSNYVYDVRYTRIGTKQTSMALAMSTEVHTLLDLTTDAHINGHTIRGVIDEESKLNIARGENTNKDNLIDNLFDMGLIDSDEADGLKTWNNVPRYTVEEALAASDCGYNTLYGDDDGQGGATNKEQSANNHQFDSENENDSNPTQFCLDGGIEDIITVSSPEIDDGSGVKVCPVNVNTASLPVLVVVLSRIPDEIPATGTYISASKVADVALAIINYRDGADNIDGTADDQPFDGMDVSSGVTVNVFNNDVLDNDGDKVNDNAGERYMFAGGARGEFNTFIDNLGLGLTTEEKTNIKDNADPAPGSYNNECWTAPFCFKSKYFTITSEGKVMDDATPANVLSSYKIKQIVGPFEDDTLD